MQSRPGRADTEVIMETHLPPLRIHLAQITADLFDAKRNAMFATGRECRVTLYLGHHEQRAFLYAIDDSVVLCEVKASQAKGDAPWKFKGFDVVPVNLGSFYRVGAEVQWD